MSTEVNEPIDLSNLTDEQLEAALVERKKSAQNAQKKREKDYVQKRDMFILAMVSQAVEASASLRKLKEEVVVRGNELHDLMYEIYQKQPKELQSFSLTTEDGLYRVEIDRSPIVGLNETAEVHIQAVKDVFTEKFGKTNKAMWSIMQRLLIKNTEGDYDPKMVVRLRAESGTVNDPRFDAAVDGLAKATYQTGTATYARFYRKSVDLNSWVVIPMQFSNMPPMPQS